MEAMAVIDEIVLLHNTTVDKINNPDGKDNRKIISAFSTLVPFITEASTAKEAVMKASKASKQGDTVLLSPACASFDLFENYEDRGNQFKEAVRSL